MSGVGITGLIEPLNGGSFPVFEDINGFGGYRVVADTPARDAIPANFRKLDMLITTQDTGIRYRLVGGLLNANWQVDMGQAPFKATYYVDPAFTGQQTGSQSNPFTTIAAAFAAMVALALPGGLVLLPPATTVTENVVFPSGGGDWEIAGVSSYTGAQGSVVARIVGTVTATAAAASIFVLSNLFVLGNTSGDNGSVSGCILMYNDVRQTGSIALTKSSSGSWLGVFKGTAAASPSKQGGSHTALVSIPGSILALDWVFEGGFTDGPALKTNPSFNSSFRGCQFGSTDGVAVPIGLNGAFQTIVQFYDCIAIGPTTITAAIANYDVQMDAATLAGFTHQGLTLVNCILTTLNANDSSLTTVTGNVGSTSYSARNIYGLYEVDFEMTLLASGTTGLLQLNVIYTDMTGTLVTVPVGGTLDISTAVGSKQQGSLRFQHNGAAAPIAFSLTGIVTPGAMSVAMASAIRRLN